MGEFMQQQGGEEQGCRDERSDPDLTRAPTRVYLTKVFGEGERAQGGDNEPAVMKPDLYARDCSEFDVGAHLRPSLRKTTQLWMVIFQQLATATLNFPRESAEKRRAES